MRERLHEVLNWHFIWGKNLDSKLPAFYGMFTPEGDAIVANATNQFLEKANKSVATVAVGKNRNLLIEDFSICTNSGENYDYFLGSAETVLPAEKPGSDDLYGDYDN